MGSSKQAVVATVIVAGLAGVVLLAVTRPKATEQPAPEPLATETPDEASTETRTETPEEAPAETPVEAPEEAPLEIVEVKPVVVLLDKRVSIDFKGSSAKEVIHFLGMGAGGKVEFDAAVVPALEKIPVTLKLTDVSLRDALETMRRLTGDSFEFAEEDGVIKIK